MSLQSFHGNGIFIDGDEFYETYLKTVEEILTHGPKKSPRGQTVTYFQNCLFQVNCPGTVFSTPNREYKFSYLNKELDLYFKGEMSAESFGKASKFWLQLANPDGNINSNYGYHVFYRPIETKFGTIKNQWTYAKTQLLNDKDTRQALIFISTPSVQFEGNKDFICTLNYVFNIEKDTLHLTVNRRSQDLYFGLPHDINFEYLLMVKMHNELKDVYPDLKIGSFNMFCNNIHIYDRNYDIFAGMIDDFDKNEYINYDVLKNVDQEILDNYVFNKEFGN